MILRYLNRLGVGLLKQSLGSSLGSCFHIRRSYSKGKLRRDYVRERSLRTDRMRENAGRHDTSGRKAPRRGPIPIKSNTQ